MTFLVTTARVEGERYRLSEALGEVGEHDYDFVEQYINLSSFCRVEPSELGGTNLYKHNSRFTIDTPFPVVVEKVILDGWVPVDSFGPAKYVSEAEYEEKSGDSEFLRDTYGKVISNNFINPERVDFWRASRPNEDDNAIAERLGVCGKSLIYFVDGSIMASVTPPNHIGSGKEAVENHKKNPNWKLIVASAFRPNDENTPSIRTKQAIEIRYQMDSHYGTFRSPFWVETYAGDIHIFKSEDLIPRLNEIWLGYWAKANARLGLDQDGFKLSPNNGESN